MPLIKNDSTIISRNETSVDTQSKTMWHSSRTDGKPLFILLNEKKGELKNSPSKPMNVVNSSTYHNQIKRLIQNLSCVNQEMDSKTVLVSGESFLFFALLNRIGSGAFGNIYLAEPNIDDNFLNFTHPIRYFRLKTKEQNIKLNFPFNETNKIVVKIELINDIKLKSLSSGQIRVDSEARLLSQCVHPNIVSYVGHSIDKELSCIVMERLKGNTLKELIVNFNNKLTTNNPGYYFSLNFIMYVFTQLCLAVEYLHRHRIMHRDIKTANIMIIKDDIVKLIDLGFAEQCQGEDHAKCLDAVVGTAYFMSPQTIQKNAYSDKTDCWALGVVLYELLELEKPFAAKSTEELAFKIVKEPYRELKRKVPTEINTLLAGLLSKDESRRLNSRQIIRYLSKYTEWVHVYLEKCRKLSNDNPSNKVSLELLEEQVRMIHKHDYALCPLSSSQQQQQHIKAITTEMQQKRIALSQNKIAFSAKLNLFFFNETVERKRMEIESDCELVMHWIDSQIKETAIHNASTNAP